jgi:DNA repair exonuclease SbcCD ATPase subunit
MYDRKLSGTESNAGELHRLKQQLKDIRSQQGVREASDFGDTVTTKINGQTVQGDVIDLFPDDMEVELSLRGPETGKTVVVNVRDTEYFESQDLTVREEEIKKSIPELEKEMDTYQTILKKSQEITKSIKYDSIPSEIITEIKMLANQFNIPEEMFKDAIDEIFDARSNLESAVYGLEEPINDRIREIENAILELEDEEYYKESNEQQSSCPECGGPLVSESSLSEKQDACYRKVKSRYKVWPSAYASGALVQCRKKGAKNWGNKSK